MTAPRQLQRQGWQVPDRDTLAAVPETTRRLALLAIIGVPGAADQLRAMCEAAEQQRTKHRTNRAARKPLNLDDEGGRV